MDKRLEQIFKESLQDLLADFGQSLKQSQQLSLGECEQGLQTLQLKWSGLETSLQENEQRTQHAISSLERRILQLEQNQQSSDLETARPD
ncbi:hypothetical protein ASE76_00055 [Xylophilus sp. Leaf220]|nr:hypothetical protein ASE76_00055 [Xylophilus sp. Leaf220]